MKRFLPVLMVFSLLLQSWSAIAYDFTVSGKVTFVNEAPFPFSFVYAVADNGDVQEMPTDEDGNYSLTFDIEDGTVASITVTTLDFCTGEEVSTTVLSEGESVVVDFEICDEITFPTCQAAFGYTLNPDEPLAVDFSNQSLGEDVDYLWDFGDGNTSTDENPSHTYAEEGIYEVSLSINGVDCESSASQPVLLDGSEPCNCIFEFDPVCVEDENGEIIPFPNACFAECEGYSEADFVDCDFGNPGDCWASFGYSTSDPAALTVDFTDASTGEPTTWAWDFGDGNTSNEQNPTHTYAEAGIYDVTLTITGDEDCESTTIQHICIGEIGNPFDGCQAAFGSFEEADLNIQFLDFSFGEIDSWAWDFGDGNTSDEQNPVHTYAEEGEYLVTLTITADTCTSTFEEVVVIGNIGGCGCDTVFDPVCVEDENGEIIPFPNACFAECEGYSEADFVECDNGGCNCGFEFDPVCVEDDNGNIIPFPNACFAECEGYSASDFVECDLGGPSDCSSLFTYAQNDPDNPLVVSFEDVSSGNGINWSWDFGDGNTSAEQNPTHTYAEEGVYEVTLFIGSVDGEVMCTQTIFISGGLPCNCDFEFDPVCVEDENGEIIPFPNACFAECEGYTASDFVDCDFPIEPTNCQASFYYTQDDPTTNTVNFMDASWEDAITWAWDFGDGNTSTEQNPVHTYAEGGIYDVTLSITTADGCMSTYMEHICIGDGIIIFPFPDCQAFFYFEQESNDLLSFQFNDLSFGANTSWAWDFGDGNTSDEQNPMHTYAEPGTYDVSLTVASDSCESTFNMLIFTDENVWYNGECNALFLPLILNDLEVTFINTSSADAATFAWDFGDGNTSDEPFPVHNYTETGSYDVTLTITTFDGCTNSFTMTVDFAESEFSGVANATSVTTSTNDLQTLAQIKSYPNPVVDRLNIEFEAKETGTYQVDIVNTAGQLLKSRNYNVVNGSNTLDLNVSDLPAGIYFTRLSNETESHSLKFVK